MSAISWTAVLGACLVLAGCGDETKITKQARSQQPGPDEHAEQVTALPPVPAEWKLVEELARAETEPVNAGELKQALALSDQHGGAIRDAFTGDMMAWQQKDAQVPEPVRAAVGHLLAWQRLGGGIDPLACDDPAEMDLAGVARAYRVARAALLLAPSKVDAPGVVAVLYLGERLRSQGASLIEAKVGMSIATTAADWAQARELELEGPFRELAPSADDVVRAMAAEALCQEKLVAHAFAHPGLEPWKNIADLTPAMVARDLSKARAFSLETLQRADQLRNQPAALAAYLETRRDQAEALDRPLLKMLVATPLRVAGQLLDQQAEYQQVQASR